MGLPLPVQVALDLVTNDNYNDDGWECCMCGYINSSDEEQCERCRHEKCEDCIE
jgi:hypothetical protein